ncbi:restriction endonuclease subunit S [Neobacillus sp. OS1-33]|uniref:restriction endonuclease subunit S n=1 Tax=Neobacillus sp. OS1-33 TaxID=3070683 RepID=UPI0027E17100|nr:restriction endonuclease subunit S [Neobacillus sp. OS1-33]WML24128.1 restriction endonuclease subunit S [Neobacillus sp. OS1-33]
MIREDWAEAKLEDMLDYIQPTNYIVESTKYSENYKIPVLTAGKSFILGYTNEEHNVFKDTPVIIFDDFTTATQFVNFKFKVKSSAMKILVRTSKLVNIKYVFYYMQTIRYNTDTHKRYWISIFSKLPIKIAPLPEQRAIVAKIEQLFSGLDNGITNLIKAKEKLEIYRQAVLKKAFEGELTKEWREKQNDVSSDISYVYLRELADVATGATPKKSNSSYWNEGDIAWVTSGALNNTFVKEASDFITEKALKETNCKVFPKGTLLIAMYGEGKTRGKCSELAIDAATNQAIAAVLIKNEYQKSKKYLKWFFIKNYNDIRMLSSGGVQPNLNLTKVKETRIPFPTNQEQEQIVKEIETRLSICDHISANIDAGLEKVEALRQSILKKAFEGTLLSEDVLEACHNEPDWEPAKKFLERIKRNEEVEI